MVIIHQSAAIFKGLFKFIKNNGDNFKNYNLSVSSTISNFSLNPNLYFIYLLLLTSLQTQNRRKDSPAAVFRAIYISLPLGRHTVDVVPIVSLRRGLCFAIIISSCI